ncbi:MULTISPECIES: hypothetical protein [unclassified Burkholderia]|uniref:hypothetical protein n=1 Tax=unclassified Burkholderia TaxID=2613784 RepID=UPI000759A7EB|nr:MULTISPECIES: hypothetical protein [unclassified Burkholderia]KVN04808.1 hypothetical protein WT08_22105 [Burkholderia sp. MSMB1552]KWZ55729.1 hypothetical protein WS92_07260 [Burkholderia sp. MSMB1588]
MEESRHNAAEQEAIGLCVSVEAIDDMVNHALLLLIDVSQFPGECETRFHSRIHQQLFLIRLLDFVKEPGDKALTGIKGSCLDMLEAACNSPALCPNGDTRSLGLAVSNLRDWLSKDREVKLWLPTLNIEARVTVSCMDLLTIAGNQSKHNLSRLTGVCRRIAQILGDQDYAVTLDMMPLALDDFREHLNENFFVYHGTWLAELLNNVRWGIQTYLAPTFRWSYREQITELPGIYRYEYPVAIQSKIAQHWFWRLMNNVRSGPIFKRFDGAHYLKTQSSLEWVDGNRDHEALP